MMMKRKPIAVIKVGGDMVIDASDRLGLAANIQDLLSAGWQCVVLHGAGPQLSLLQNTHGLVPNKVDGRRITKQEDLVVVKQALCGEVNVDLVAGLIAGGVAAFGCHGASGLLIEAAKRPPVDLGGRGVIDFGEVGDVVDVNVNLIHLLLDAGQVPVIASLGVDANGRIFNINADTTVAAVAKALKAKLLILSTKVGGVFKDIDDPSSRISEVTQSSAKALIQNGIITDGMVPKVEEALALLEHGVGSVAITNASQSGGFLALASGDDSIGTRIVSE